MPCSSATQIAPSGPTVSPCGSESGVGSGMPSIAPSVVIAERASTRTTVVEVNARDREGLLARLALAIHGQGHQVHSAHIATYGERAVDTFYLTNAAGRKLSAADIAALRTALIAATSPADRARNAA